MNRIETDFGAKKEIFVGDPNNSTKPQKTTTSSSRQWSSYKNPRIVRASRAFGGKDRHSKVATVRGLRDRRIRLSVPTAVQLYSLQERLGLSQPSKVVDWLIDVTKEDIDKLPPLPSIPQLFHHQSSPNYNSLLPPQYSSLLSHGVKMNESDDHVSHDHQGQGRNDQEGFGGSSSSFVAQNFFPVSNIINQSSYNPNNMPSNFNWDPSNLSLSQFGGGINNSFPNDQAQDHHDHTPSLARSSHLYFCSSSTSIIPSFAPPFPSYITPFMENELIRQNNHLHHVQQNSIFMPTTTLHLISSTPPVKPFVSNGNSTNVRSQEND